MSHTTRTAVLVTTALFVVTAAASCSLVADRPSVPVSSPASSTAPPSTESSSSGPPSTESSRGAPAATSDLPIAVHDAVVPELLAARRDPVRWAARPAHDLVLTAEPDGRPVAVLPERDFLGEPTTIAVVEERGRWVRILTPARRVLPSAVPPGAADAQTAAWVRRADLVGRASVTSSITVSVGAQRMTIVTPDGTTEHPVGVGTARTPTPTGVTGYLQARYTDALQGQPMSAIQLTSLHATSADEPYGGRDGGLIGIHAAETATGAVSHGCVRVGADVVTVLDGLPLGTPVTIVA